MSNAEWNVIVIGAGAAGLIAALRAAERGRRVLLLEKNRKAGVKILMSGGTRCNITQATDNRGIVEAFGPPGKFLHSALAALSVEATVELFEVEGVATKVEETGKIFPVSNKANDVLQALLRRLDRSGAVLALGEAVTELGVHEGRFRVETSQRVLSAGRVILTTGGQSYPASGTTGDGYRWISALGHTIVPPRPALTPLLTRAVWVQELRGVTLPDVRVRIIDRQAELASRRGSLLFAHFGLSGPVILDVSRVVSGHPKPQTLEVEIDFLPETTVQQVGDELRRQSVVSGKKLLAAVLPAQLPRRLCETLLVLADLPRDRKAAALAKEERNRLVSVLKALRIAIDGTLGFGKAEVTAGGVALEEVDSRTVQSKLVPGLFLAGEILDLDGPIGGYNFQAAWSTGWLAGSSV
ncbi:MAG: NAD(P)/FAD-dependent oxidoreductase [Gemmataceae bacterium]|nr:NAD(P)/FAD-dependent oxidoreductase [Gemmataceae bacterium]